MISQEKLDRILEPFRRCPACKSPPGDHARVPDVAGGLAQVVCARCGTVVRKASQ